MKVTVSATGCHGVWREAAATLCAALGQHRRLKTTQGRRMLFNSYIFIFGFLPVVLNTTVFPTTIR